MEETATASSDKEEDDEEKKMEDENNEGDEAEDDPTTEDEEKPEGRDEDKEDTDEDNERAAEDQESLDEDKVELEEEREEKKEEQKETPGLSLLACPRPSLSGMDDDDDDEIEDEELEAFLQRNFSERRRSRWGLRRASSPFTAEGARRRLSTFTVSSGDETAISIDEGEITEEEILENIRINKELIESIRYQPWRMKKKYKSLRQAKAYVKKHEGELMQSKKSGDILAKYTIIFSRGWNKFKRELANLIVILTPWEMRIKKIESQFGSVVASYFIFLRWVFWVNFFITIFVCCFLMVPEVIRGIDDGSGMRKGVEGEEEGSALNLNAIWNFEGYLKYSPIFYGYYGCAEMTSEGYRLPLAYFLTSLCVYIFSFFVILRKMAENSRMSKLSEKDDECTFAWKLFTGWDYMIGNAETAYNKTASLVMGFKEAILEEKEKKKEDKSWKMITLRVIANFLVFILLTSSAYTIVLVVERSEEPEAKDEDGHWWRKHELQIVVGCIGTIFPNLFEMIGLMEKYHPRIQLRWQLARILVLNLLNLYTLIFSLFNRVLGMIEILDEIKQNITITNEDTIDRMNLSMSFQVPSSLNLIASQHIIFDSVDTDFQNCTVTIIQNCTIAALLNQFRNRTIHTYDSSDSTQIYNTSFPYYNATDDTYEDDADMDSDYADVIMRISNYTAHGVVNWTLPGSVKRVHPPLYFSNGTARFDSLYPDDFWELPINTSHLGFDDDNLTTTIRTTIYDRNKNATTSTWLTPDETVMWILNNTEMWNVTEEPTTATEQLNCTVRLCLPYVTTSSPDDNLTADVTDYTTTTRADLTEGSTVVLNVTDDNFTTIVTEGTDVVPTATPMPTVCCGSRCSQPQYKSPPPKREDIPSIDVLKNSPDEIRANLKKNCWETMFGQELVKLTVSDVPMTIVMTLLTDFIRAVFVRYANQCWCWDLEKGFPGYGDFKIAENILHLVNNQGMIWMGMFFAPGLPAINTVKLCILLYFRSWVVLTCNIPHETVFKASGSNNFYFALLLIMLFLCTLPVGFAVVWLDPSWHCGPFSQYRRIYGVFTTYLEGVFPSWLNKVMEYVTSPGVVIPLLLLLVLIIYYLLSLTGSLRESNNDLKLQLRREKSSGKPAKDSEEKAKDKAEETQNEANKWSSAKKILPVLPNKFRVSGNVPGEDDNDDDDEDKQTDSRSRRVQYSGDDEQTEEPTGTDSPPTSENQATKNSTAQKSKRTPKPLLKSVENLRKEEGDERRKSGRVTTGSVGSIDVPVITISQPSESKMKIKESLNGVEKKLPSPRHGKLTKKASEPTTLTPSRNKKGKKKRGTSLEEVHSESDVGNGSDARTERSTDDTETSDPEGNVLNNQPARDRRKRGEMTRYHGSRSHSSSLDTPPLIEEEEEDGRKSTLPIAATKAKLQRQQADTDSLGSTQRPKSTTDAESTSDERKEALKENGDKKAKIQRLSTDSL